MVRSRNRDWWCANCAEWQFVKNNFCRGCGIPKAANAREQEATPQVGKEKVRGRSRSSRARRHRGHSGSPSPLAARASGSTEEAPPPKPQLLEARKEEAAAPADPPSQKVQGDSSRPRRAGAEASRTWTSRSPCRQEAGKDSERQSRRKKEDTAQEGVVKKERDPSPLPPSAGAEGAQAQVGSHGCHHHLAL